MSGATDVPDSVDVAIVGAGPAGLSAAMVCAGAGLSTILFDEQPAPGGQIYRAVGASPVKRAAVLGNDYWYGARLVRAFHACGARYVPHATVWSVTPTGEIGVSVNGIARLLQARRVLIATGALERPFPIPGWTLPGVMTAGAGQILLKSAALVPQGRTVLAGSGPLLWLLAWQYLNAGVAIDAILDTTPHANRRAAWPHAPSFLLSPYFRKGLRLLLSVRRRTRVIGKVTDLRAEGDDALRAVVYRTDDGNETRLAVDTLLLHQGVVPNVNLAMSAGIEHHWDDDQLCFVPDIDGYGGTSVQAIAIAGDGAGIAGAWAAEERGKLAALATVRALKPDVARDRLPDEARVRLALAQIDRGRLFLERLYRPADRFRRPEGDTTVCRCEEVTARQIIETVALGCTGPNQMKAFLRCGMGPCQGRLCGLTVTELMAQARGVAPADVGYYRLRPPVKPITLGELAALPKDPAAVSAVERG
ncbi:MAG: FAD-dependent oxidoreductase [Alphaproteobacteria bacterium]|nr:FAD-dependent oxidoreductase [Alphaproteobacteria bacterium]